MYFNSDTLRFLKKWLLPIVLGIGMMRALVKEGFAQSNPLIGISEFQSMPPESGTIEVSKPGEFAKGHLPGAVNAWRPDYQDNSYPFEGIRASREQIEKLMQRLGINPAAPLVLYDEAGNVNAAHLRWILLEYGHKGPVYLLQGGKGAWERAGLSLNTDILAPRLSTFRFPSPTVPDEDPTGLALAKSASKDASYKIVDCRSLGEYLGKTFKTGSGRAGRIPGSIHFDLDNFQQYRDGEYLGLVPEAQMRHMLDSIGLRPEDKIMVYSHSGARSALLAMVLHDQLGYRNVRNYDGSWVEWSSIPELPTETGTPAVAQTSAVSTPPEIGPDSAVSAKAKGIGKYGEIVKESYKGFLGYLVDEITFGYDYKPIWLNYFWGLILISLFFFGLELIKPWRPDQPHFRKDFWLDAFYMFFNFFLFGLIIFAAVQNVFTELFNDFLGLFGLENIVALQIDKFPVWAYFGILFLVADFLQWWVHRLLHRVEWLWNFHKVHHSVEQMGFAAHLRYHWMENVVYKGLTAIPLTMLGYNLVDLGVLHLFNLAWGHFNHSNIHVPTKVSGAIFGGLLVFGITSLYPESVAGMSGSVSPFLVQGGLILGGVLFGYFVLRYVMRYLFNSPEMHLWHHAWELPPDKPYGVNFGLTLGIWDWIFGTVYWPHDRGDVKLGFQELEKFPKTFWGQLVYGLGWKKSKSQSPESNSPTPK